MKIDGQEIKGAGFTGPLMYGRIVGKPCAWVVVDTKARKIVGRATNLNDAAAVARQLRASK